MPSSEVSIGAPLTEARTSSSSTGPIATRLSRTGAPRTKPS